MGNVCDMDPECLQADPREPFRARSRTDSFSDKSLRDFVQIKQKKLSSEYTLNQLLGQGSFGSVYKVTHNSTKVVRAAKRIEKRKRSIESLEEYSILRKLDHPNIIRIYDIYAERKYLYIVMDYCQGGELFDRIIDRGNLTENEAKHYMKQLLSAIHHCHSNQIMHRDLKPQNIVFLNRKAQDLKIIDFGVGTSFGNEKTTSLKVGSIYYMAPEVIKKNYSHQCDIWSLGVILYILLTGRPPFNGKNDREIYAAIEKGKVAFPERRWKNISMRAKDLVQKMIHYDPKTRISARDALKHPWILHHSEEGDDQLYLENELGSIKHFCEMNQFQSAIMVYISHNFLQNELLTELEQKFKAIDVNGDGRISWKEFLECYQEHMPPLPESEIFKLFSNLDRNHSGFVDYSEFLTTTMNTNYIVNENLVEKAFDMIDKNGNGFLSREELVEAFGGCSGDVADEIMGQFDINNDGQISKYEFKLAMKGIAKPTAPTTKSK